MIVVFNGVKPVAHFAEAATALNIAAFVLAGREGYVGVPWRSMGECDAERNHRALSCWRVSQKTPKAHATTSSGDNDYQNKSYIEVAMAGAAAKTRCSVRRPRRRRLLLVGGNTAPGYMDDGVGVRLPRRRRRRSTVSSRRRALVH